MALILFLYAEYMYCQIWGSVRKDICTLHIGKFNNEHYNLVIFDRNSTEQTLYYFDITQLEQLSLNIWNHEITNCIFNVETIYRNSYLLRGRSISSLKSRKTLKCHADNNRYFLTHASLFHAFIHRLKFRYSVKVIYYRRHPIRYRIWNP